MLLAGVTTATAFLCGLMSRFASCPCNSVYGAKYSYRRPTLNDKPGRTRQSSCAYQLAAQLRK